MTYDPDIDDRADYLESIGLNLGWNAGLVKCQICHSHWHRPEYETCYDCRPPWLFFDRKEFTPEQKFDIMERDDFACASCGGRDEYLQIDHVKPCAWGGEADLWNGQVLCGPCNLKKGSDWRNSEWPKRRIQLMHFYLTFGWGWMSYAEQDLLVAEASGRREVIGYYPLNGFVTAEWLQDQVGHRKIVVAKSTPSVQLAGDRFVLADQQGPLPLYINITDAQIEGRRTIDYGDKFTWHAHVSGSPPVPQWAVEMADANHGSPPTWPTWRGAGLDPFEEYR